VGRGREVDVEAEGERRLENQRGRNQYAGREGEVEPGKMVNTEHRRLSVAGD